MERSGRAALTAWLAATDGAAALLIPHVRLVDVDICCSCLWRLILQIPLSCSPVL